ncbi:hypothetical protein FRB97_005038 [Tulasnella sp. 331]|nr:hypothetical protein FRB97_005038 [Tulasnella sp. 331]
MGRKNVTISYSRIDDESINQTFLDTIQFNFSQKSDPEKEPTMVGGVDTLQLIDPRDESSAGESDSKAVNGVRYRWKGKGIMTVSPSGELAGARVLLGQRSEEER